MGFIFANIVVCYLEALNLLVMLYDFERHIRSHLNVSNPQQSPTGRPWDICVILAAVARQRIGWGRSVSPTGSLSKSCRPPLSVPMLGQVGAKEILAREYVKPRRHHHHHHHPLISISLVHQHRHHSIVFVNIVMCLLRLLQKALVFIIIFIVMYM